MASVDSWFCSISKKLDYPAKNTKKYQNWKRRYLNLVKETLLIIKKRSHSLEQFMIQLLRSGTRQFPNMDENDDQRIT